MKQFILFISLTLITFGALAEVYKWTDSQGNTHFSDVPHDGAEKMDVPNTQSSPAPTSNTDNSSGSNSSKQDNETTERQQYTKVEITQPKNEETIHNKDSVTIQVKIDPELYEKDNVQIIYDGNRIGDPQHNLIFKLKGMQKGSHKLLVQVVDTDGEVLIASEPTTFFIQKPEADAGNSTKSTN